MATGLEQDGAGVAALLRAGDLPGLQQLLVRCRAAAVQGDKEALATLAQLLVDREGTGQLAPADRERVVGKAFEALRAAETQLGKGEYDALLAALDDPLLARDAEELLTGAARQGRGAAAASLRSAARAGGPGGERAIQVLAQVRSVLVPEDYALIGPIGLRCVGDSPATRLIFETAAEGKPATLALLRATLRAAPQADGDPMLNYAQVRAAKLLAENLDNIETDLLPHLARLARAGKVEDRVVILRAIAQLAAQSPPLPGAAAALVEVLEELPAKVSFDRLEPLRGVGRTYVMGAFGAAEEAGDVESMTALAPYVMRRAKASELAITCAELLYPLVMEGDTRALGSLAETAGRLISGGGEDACKLSVKMLEAAAKSGQAEAVVLALLDEVGKPGKNDDERGLEALGRATRHLDRGSALNKRVRVALRKAIKMFHPLRTRGHLSALRGMAAIPDRLRDKDITALIDNLGFEAGQVLAAAAPHLKPEALEDLRAVLEDRLAKNMNVKGARVALDGVEKVAPVPLRAPTIAVTAPQAAAARARSRPVEPRRVNEQLGSRDLQKILAETAERDLLDDKDD